MNYDQQRDDFALLFLNWVSKNYRQMSQDTYCHISDFRQPGDKGNFLTIKELLGQFKREHIPATSELASFPDKALAMLEQQVMRANILLTGMIEIQALALQAGPLNKEVLLARISSFFNKFATYEASK